MYSPEHNDEKRSELIFEVVKNNSFATLITPGNEGLQISHLPLLLAGADGPGEGKLLGHLARANEHWRHFGGGRTVTAVFSGPHSYISPSWYQPSPDNVPTWNYAVVHLEGQARLIESPADAYEILRKSVVYFEESMQTGWALPKEPNFELQSLLKGIVAFEIEITKVRAKFKLSQREEPANRKNVIHELSGRSEMQTLLAAYMERAVL